MSLDLSDGHYVLTDPLVPDDSIVATDLIFSTVRVTPALAEKWLELNIKNRNPKAAKIAQYTEDMRTGNWRINGEAMKFSITPRMIDGQNRCFACIKADTPFITAVIEGLEDLDQETLDGQAPRRYSDVLKLRGEADSQGLAAAVRSLNGWQRGHRSFDGGAVGRVASNTMLDVTLGKYPELRENLAYIRRVSRHSHIPVSVLGSLWWAFHNADPEDAAFFFDRLVSDEDHHSGEPIFALRRALSARRDRAGTYPNPTYVAALTIKAWNAFRAGAEVQVLVWKPGGASKEKFPELK